MRKSKYFLAIVIAGVFFPFFTHAATLGFSPSKVASSAGSIFSVGVYVSTPSASMNAASGVVSFPIDKLEVVSVSKAGSVINLWVQEPTYSNTLGTVNFEGIALNPGYTGNQGTIITITFRAKSSGQANINFSSGSILANDGTGTNILQGLGSGGVSIEKQIIKIPETPVENDVIKSEVPALLVVPEAPVITYYSEEIRSGDNVKIRGVTYPDSDVVVVFKDKDEVISEEHTKSNSFGDWAVVVSSKHFAPGAYTFTAQMINDDGVKSKETPPLTIVVNPKFLDNLINLILNYLSAIILVVLVLAGVVIIGVYIWYRFIKIIRHLRREGREAEQVLEKSFALLRKDINEHIALLKKAESKRQLSSEEIAFLEQFKEELTEVKDIVKKEVEDIWHS